MTTSITIGEIFVLVVLRTSWKKLSRMRGNAILFRSVSTVSIMVPQKELTLQCHCRVDSILFIFSTNVSILITKSHVIGYYCPANWDTSRYLKTSFFTKTLPKIASLLSIVPVALDQDNRPICTRKQKRQEDLIPSGVVFIPFTLGIVTELFKAISVVEDSYEISFLEREQLMIEHPMFAATTSIPDDEMKLFNKNPRPEDGYAGDLFKNIDGVGSAANNVDVGSLKVYVSNNCPDSTRMIKLTVKTDSI